MPEETSPASSIDSVVPPDAGVKPLPPMLPPLSVDALPANQRRRVSISMSHDLDFKPPEPVQKPQPAQMHDPFAQNILIEEDASEEMEPVERHRTSTSSSINNVNGTELHETILIKLRWTVWSLIAGLFNILILILISKAQAENGLKFNLGAGVGQGSLTIFFLMLFLICFATTKLAIEYAMAIYLGTKLASPTGYSVVCCAFLQANWIDRLTFGTNLNFKSKARSLLTRLGMIGFIHVMTVILAFWAPSQLYLEHAREMGPSLSCLIYNAQAKPVDRKWPTVQLEMGVAEYVFASSIGIMRSENNVPNSTFVMPPQLIDVSDDSSTIRGNGVTFGIFTNCTCAYSQDRAELLSRGISDANYPSMAQYLQVLNGSVGIVNSVEKKGSTISIMTLLSGSAVCSRYNTTNAPVPVCQTTISDPRTALIEIMYMTDGCPASIAAKTVTILSLGPKSNIDYLEYGYKVLLGTTGYVALPPTFPGSINPLLWWTSPNMQVVSPSLLESGLETTFALISKVMVQRTFQTSGQSCPQVVLSSSYLKLAFTPMGYIISLTFGWIQLICTVLSFVGYLQWYQSDVPMLPAFRLTTDHLYFASMLRKSPRMIEALDDLSLFAKKEQVWLTIDTNVRIGESILTKDDSDFGEIAMDKPKMIVDLARGKLYK